MPLPNSGIPFMPKTSLTTEEQTLYLVQKDKYVIEAIVKSQGVPYCDTFDIRMRKTVSKTEERTSLSIQTALRCLFNSSSTSTKT